MMPNGTGSTLCDVRRAGRALCATACLLFCACETEPDAPVSASAELSGTYRLSSDDGRELTLRIVEQNGSLTGIGQIGDERFNLAAARQPSAVGVLRRADGSHTPVRLTGSSVSGVTLTLDGTDDFTLLPDLPDTPVPTPDGVFSGDYAGAGDGVEQATATLDQYGDAVTGRARILGASVSVVGVANDNRLNGEALYADGTRLRLSADLDGDILVVRGFGAPQRLSRR